MAALDFSQVINTSDKHDMIDAIALGLNMMSEELNSNVVEKSMLDSVNRKLEKFAYTTAHDLKSPLNAINGLVNLMELSLASGKVEEVNEYIGLLNVTTEKMKTLVQGILDYSRVDAAHIDMTDLDLNAILKEVIEVDQLSSVADIKIVGALPNVFFNRSALDQIVRNLLNNAVKHTTDEICQIMIRYKDKGDHHQISVSDNGPGIPPQYHERIFELFHTGGVESNAESHGIGLATVKSILDSFGERIWVESSVGKGATFYFTLKKHHQA
jgi:signal transduction histidine kinase